MVASRVPLTSQDVSLELGARCFRSHSANTNWQLLYASPLLGHPPPSLPSWESQAWEGGGKVGRQTLAHTVDPGAQWKGKVWLGGFSEPSDPFWL